MTVERVVGRVFCERPKGAHELVVVRQTATGRVAEVTVAVNAATGIRQVKDKFNEIDVPATVHLTATAYCRCGAAWDIDISSLLRGEKVQPRRIKPRPDHGDSYRRLPD